MLIKHFSLDCHRHKLNFSIISLECAQKYRKYLYLLKSKLKVNICAWISQSNTKLIKNYWKILLLHSRLKGESVTNSHHYLSIRNAKQKTKNSKWHTSTHQNGIKMTKNDDRARQLFTIFQFWCEMLLQWLRRETEN